MFFLRTTFALLLHASISLRAKRDDRAIDLTFLHHLEKALSHLEKYIAEYRGIEPMRSRPGFMQRPKKQSLITGSIYDVADPSEEQTDSRSGFRRQPFTWVSGFQGRF